MLQWGILFFVVSFWLEMISGDLSCHNTAVHSQV